MALIDRATAKRIDRLSRRAHAFHRFAHHPLCGAYEGEVIRVGRRVRLCRGCSYVALGLLLGALAATVTQVSSTPWLVLVLAVAVLLASIEVRVSKLVTRAAPAALLGFAVAAGMQLDTRAGACVSAAAVATLAGLALRYRRRGPDRVPCASCRERTLDVCSGLLPIVRRERAFQRASRRLIVVFR